MGLDNSLEPIHWTIMVMFQIRSMIVQEILGTTQEYKDNPQEVDNNRF